MVVASGLLLSGAIIATSCNNEDVVTVQGPPKIKLDSETGIYTVKAGKELTISPEFVNVDGEATIEWLEEGESLSGSRELTVSWSEPGEHFITLRVVTDGGTAKEEIRVDVVALEVPSISLPFASDMISVRRGTEYAITPEIAHSDGEEFEIEWIVNGESAGRERTYTFSAEQEGEYKIEVKTKNEDGTDSKMFRIKVADTLPYELSFAPQSYFNGSTERYTFAGRGVCLSPIMENLDGETWEWSVDGVPVECNERIMVFTPDAPGKYRVNVVVDGIAMASVTVVCVEGDEKSRFRAATSGSSAWSTKVYEWVPAPGQFIGETVSGGMIGNETTHELAVAWAEERLKNGLFVSLGGFGGYIVVGFDHSIQMKEGNYDFSIGGNAFLNATTGDGGSNEPGIVYVMQDVNGNGLPDDEWFELRGSDSGKETTRHDYAVTYYRPSGKGMSVQWSDNYGGSGSIDYLSAFHKQDYYYPAWIEADSYKLRGTCLEARTVQNPSTGLWDNNAFEWGYADNLGGDNIESDDAVTGDGQRNGFLIENAMRQDGTHVKLQYIDFIKVQTGVNSKSGWLGEVSTEVFGFKDLSTNLQ